MKLPRTPSFRLDGRTALVFGASSGIGLGAAMALAEAGAHVVCAARGADRLNEAVAAMREAGLVAEAAVLDIADIDAVRAAVSGLGRLDVMAVYGRGDASCTNSRRSRTFCTPVSTGK